MKKLGQKNAVTLVEMIATLVVGSLLVFILGTFINVSNRSYAATVQGSGMNTSLMYGLKLLQNRVHGAKFLSETAASGAWKSEQLICDNLMAFGIYQASAGATKDFIYVPDKGVITGRQVIFSVLPTESINFSVTISGPTATVTVNGTMNDEPFKVTSTVMRRS